MRSRALIALLAVLLFAAAGCGSKPAARLTGAQLERLVLQPSDVPGFEEFDSGRQARADAHPGPRHDPGRFGRQDGWKARYRRGGGPSTRGPLIVESRVDVFGDSAGAKHDLAAYRAEFEAQASVGARPVTVPRVGDEALASVVVQGTTRNGVATETVAWRQGRLTASITANGFSGGLRLQDVLALARKQQARLVASS